MIAPIKQDTQKQLLYKIVLSIVFGLIGYFINSQSIVILPQPYRVCLMLGLLLPMIITQSWGWKYGLLSALAMAFLHAKWIFTEGYPALLTIPLFLIWIAWHGYCSEKRGVSNKVFWNQYIVELPYRIIQVILLYTLFRQLFELNSLIWDPNVKYSSIPISVINTIALIEVVNGYIVLLMSDLMLNIDTIRKVLKLKTIDRETVKASQIVGIAILFGCLYWILDAIIDYLIFYPNQGNILDLLILKVPPQELFSRSAFLLACLLGGVLLWKFISGRMESEQALNLAEHRFKLVVELSPYPIAIIDSNYVFEYLNPRFTETFGYTTEEIPSINDWIKKLHPSKEKAADKTEKWDEYFKKHMNSATVSSLTEISNKKGEKRIVQLKLMQMKESKYFIIFEDITKRKQAEAQLQKLNEELEKRVEKRTSELKDTNMALKNTLDELRSTQQQLIDSEKMAALGNLVAGVAHEINTPIGIGITAISHLNQKSKDMDERFTNSKLKKSDLRKYVEIATESSSLVLSNLNRAADLVRSFKQIAVDQSVEEKRTFNIREYLDEILNSLHHQIKRTKHEIKIDCPDNLKITSYPGAFYQIVVNLLINTLVHGFDGIEEGIINIKVSEKNDEFFIEFSDNGVGIKKDILGRIFDPFFTTRREQGGSGLGLHIVYNLVNHKLGGKISCNSKYRKGTVFNIEIPDMK